MVAANMIRVESLDQEGRGVAHADGKVIFIQGALPGERVTYASYLKKPGYELAQVQAVIDDFKRFLELGVNAYAENQRRSLQKQEEQARQQKHREIEAEQRRLDVLASIKY